MNSVVTGQALHVTISITLEHIYYICDKTWKETKTISEMKKCCVFSMGLILVLQYTINDVGAEEK